MIQFEWFLKGATVRATCEKFGSDKINTRAVQSSLREQNKEEKESALFRASIFKAEQV